MEKFKRLSYIVMAILSIVLPILLTIIFHKSDSKLNLPMEVLLISTVFLAFYMVTSLVINWVSALVGSNKKFDMFLYIPFQIGIALLNMKRVYYSELGYFYIRMRKNKDRTFHITLYKQGFMYCKHILSTEFYGDIERLKVDIRSQLNTKYKEEIWQKNEIKRKKDEIKSREESFKKWDGYLDIQSKRDGKINQIL